MYTLVQLFNISEINKLVAIENSSFYFFHIDFRQLHFYYMYQDVAVNPAHRTTFLDFSSKLKLTKINMSVKKLHYAALIH